MCCSIVLSSASFLNSKRRFCFSSFCSSSCRAGSGILGLTLRNSCRFDPPTGKGRACKGQAAICSSRAGTTQELLDLAEESRRFRLRVLGRQSFEFAQQFALSPAEFLRRLDQDLNVHIAGLFGAQHRHALALKAEAPPRLGAFRHLHATMVAVDRRHLDLAAERRQHHGDRHPAVQIGALALKEWMRAEREENVEIPGRSTAHARLALAREPDAGAILDARGDVDRKRALARHPPGARARRAGIIDDLAAALAGRTGPLEREETLGVTDASLAAAGRTSLGFGAGLGARAGTPLAGHRGRDAHLSGLAAIGFLQGDFHVVAQIGAALAPAAASTATAAHAEQVIEDVGEGGSHVAEAVGRAEAGMLEGGVAEAVIGRALVGILENLIGLVDLFEADFAALV